MIEEYYVVGGVGVGARFADERLPGPFSRIMTYFGASQRPAGGRADIWLDVAVLEENPIPGAAELLGRERELSIYRHGSTTYISAGPSVSHVHLDNREGRIYLKNGDGPGGVTGPDLVATTMAVLALLRSEGRFGLHGAALVRDGMGWLFIGESDSGKSTLAYTLLNAGWDYLTDDSMLAAAEADGVNVYPLRRDFCMDPDAADLFPEVQHFWREQFTDAGKRMIEIDRIFGAQHTTKTRAHYLVFPAIVRGKESSMRGIGRTEALRRLLSQSALLGIEPRYASAQMDVLRRLVEQSSCFELRAAPDIKGNPTRADDLLSTVLVEAYS